MQTSIAKPLEMLCKVEMAEQASIVKQGKGIRRRIQRKAT